jgi:hypothetical protein
MEQGDGGIGSGVCTAYVTPAPVTACFPKAWFSLFAYSTHHCTLPIYHISILHSKVVAREMSRVRVLHIVQTDTLVARFCKWHFGVMVGLAPVFCNKLQYVLSTCICWNHLHVGIQF